MEKKTQPEESPRPTRWITWDEALILVLFFAGLAAAFYTIEWVWAANPLALVSIAVMAMSWPPMLWLIRSGENRG